MDALEMLCQQIEYIFVDNPLLIYSQGERGCYMFNALNQSV